MAKAQAEAIRKELLDRATGKGKEPTWEGEPTKLQLVQALNFYTSTVEVEKLQQYAIAWAKKFSPSNVELIGAQPAWKFQTTGALMRLTTRGLKLSKAHLKMITDFVSALEMSATKTNKPTKTKGKKKTMTTNDNANYRNFCEALDDICGAKKFSEPKFKPVPGHSTAPVVETCERELESIKEDPSIYPEYMKKWFRAVIQNMGGPTPAANDSTSVKKKAAKPAAKPKVEDKAPPAPKTKAAAKPKAAAAKPAKTTVALPDASNDGDPNCPLTGKKTAYLFDTRYGRLIKLVSNDKGGFKIKGKTIHGICEKTSKVALLKNFGDAMKPGASNADELEAWLGKCVKKGNPIPVSTRVVKEVLVLAAA